MEIDQWTAGTLQADGVAGKIWNVNLCRVKGAMGSQWEWNKRSLKSQLAGHQRIDPSPNPSISALVKWTVQWINKKHTYATFASPACVSACSKMGVEKPSNKPCNISEWTRKLSICIVNLSSWMHLQSFRKRCRLQIMLTVSQRRSVIMLRVMCTGGTVSEGTGLRGLGKV